MKRRKGTRRRQNPDRISDQGPGPSHGRPPKRHTGVTRYHPDFIILICERIATTPLPLHRICEAPDMPGVATLFRWLREYPDFRDLYVLAKQAQAEILIEQALDLVDDASQDLIVTPEGRIIFNTAALRRCQMRVAFRQWIAAKMLPRKYGPRPEPHVASVAPKSPPVPRPHSTAPASHLEPQEKSCPEPHDGTSPAATHFDQAQTALTPKPPPS